MEDLKAQVVGKIDADYQRLSNLALKIHSNPELGFHEVKATEWLTGYLRENGFCIESGIGGLSTAFKASYGKGRPAIAILAEYDALPELGHACGHNLIATSAVAAGMVSRLAVDRYGGSILVIGTPAEELYGGKVLMADKGEFSNLDAAMIVHPGNYDTATTQALACHGIEVEFVGKAAHAAASPEAGINALDAMIQSFTAINALRQHIKSTARIHGIITDGGQAANIVPAHSAGYFIIRDEDDTYLDELKEKVLNCFIAGATASGARLQYKWDEARYAPMFNNQTLANLYIDNMLSLCHEVALSDPGGMVGSTDMGNVSQLVPSIHPHVKITNDEVLIHSPEFARIAGSETAIRKMLDAAKALAMIVIDLMSGPETLDKVKIEFDSRLKEAGSQS